MSLCDLCVEDTVYEPLRTLRDQYSSALRETSRKMSERKPEETSNFRMQ
jgi:hypothetical protein